MDPLHIELAQPGERTASLSSFREHALRRGVNPFLYWTLRAILVPFFLIYFRLQRIGREHLPREGPLLLASNHRSFLDPFVIGTLVRRPVYYMAKRELFEKRWQAWVLNALGAFPVDRGAGDGDAMETARAILERGDCVVGLPGGHPRAPRPARRPPARRRAPGARDRRAGGSRRGDRHRRRAPGLAHPSAQGSHARRAGRCCFPTSSAARPRSPLASPSASGRASACSGTGWAAPRLVRPSSSHEAAAARDLPRRLIVPHRVRG